MLKILVALLLGLPFMPLVGMENPRGAKRRLFPAQEEPKDTPSRNVMGTPTKGGYGTASDVGTPLKLKKTLADLGISKVNITNFTGKPALVAFQGPQGQSHRTLGDFDSSENKQESHLSTAMNLVRNELYITALPELFKIQVSPNRKRLEFSKAIGATEHHKDGFIPFADLPYEAGKILTIKIRARENKVEPVELETQYE